MRAECALSRPRSVMLQIIFTGERQKNPGHRARGSCRRVLRADAQISRNTHTAFWPPKPKPFASAALISVFFATFGV